MATKYDTENLIFADTYLARQTVRVPMPAEGQVTVAGPFEFGVMPVKKRAFVSSKVDLAVHQDDPELITLTLIINAQPDDFLEWREQQQAKLLLEAFEQLGEEPQP